MGALLQLRMLLWKNYILRKRHLGRLAAEIIWPIFLFVILFLVRLRGLKNYHHQCYFEEKALPSAGMMNFAQSFFCTYNNTCNVNEWKEPRFYENYNITFYESLATALETSLKNSFDTQAEADSFGVVIGEMMDLLPVLNALRSNQQQLILPADLNPLEALTSNSDQMMQQLVATMEAYSVSAEDLESFQLLSKVKVDLNRLNSVGLGNITNLMASENSTLCDSTIASTFVTGLTEDELKRLLNVACRLESEQVQNLTSEMMSNADPFAVIDQINKLIVDNGGSSISVPDWLTMISTMGETWVYLQNFTSVQILMNDIQLAMSDMLKIFNASGRQESTNATNVTSENSTAPLIDIEVIAAASRLICRRNLSLTAFSSGGTATQFDQLRDRLQDKDSEGSKYVFDNSTSQECNEIMQNFEKSPGIGFLWSQLKPFIRGKILYTPDNIATRKIIEKINDTFSSMEGWQNYLDEEIPIYLDQAKTFFLNPVVQQRIKDYFTSNSTYQATPGFMDGMNSTMGNADNKTMDERLNDYFNGNFSETWRRSFEQLEYLRSNISLYFSCFQMDKFQPVASENEMESLGLKLIETNTLWAGLVFSNVAKGQETVPTMLTYKIRMDADKVDSTKRVEDRLSRKGPRRRPGIDLKYLYYGFAYLQDMVDRAVTTLHSGRNMSLLPGIYMQQSPYPCYIEDRFVIAIARTFPLFMTLAWVYSASMIIKSIVHEKETRLKETMRVMGLNNWVHWVSWFIDSFCVMFVSCTCLSIILVYGDILGNSDPSLVFWFMMCYTISTITLSFFLSTLFSRANIAAAAGGIIFFILYLPYSFMVVWEESLESSTKILSCLISNIAFGFGCAYFSHYEESGIGAHWDNIWTSPLLDDDFSMAGCMGMMLLDSIIYLILTWYIEAVFPGEYGVPKPFYFFLTKSYWTGRGISVPQYGSDVELNNRDRVNSQIETEPTHLNLGVSIKNLHKVYRSGKVAVEDLNLNFYEGQITSFLGHNGAGKTTTISILTGLFPPTTGTAFIYGLDITKYMDKIRNSLGTCPQHNVLFNELTVEEHLEFFARLKNQPLATLRPQIDSMIEDLGIPHKRDEKSENLSGGMQRKLSIACAFVGGSKVVVLDEPTAGVDPYSRRAIWDLLLKYKEGRTIILTTHFMDEADLLGDRIAIINNGKLVCAGSSLFLKSLYGNGYYLTLVKGQPKVSSKASSAKTQDGASTSRSNLIDDIVEESLTEREGELCSIEPEEAAVGAEASRASTSRPARGNGLRDEGPAIDDDEGISDVDVVGNGVINPSAKMTIVYLTKFIQKHIPDANLVEQIGQEIVFLLPVGSNKEQRMREFEQMFNELDNNLSKLQISTYGLSDTTLEEIFLKVARNVNDGDILRGSGGTPGGGSDFFDSDSDRVKSSIGVERRRRRSTMSFEDIDPKTSNKKWTNNERERRSARGISRAEQGQIQQKKYSGHALFLRHLFALEVKRFHHSRRNYKGFICEILLPAIFVSLAMGFTLILPPLEEEPPLEIKPEMYPAKGGMNYMFYADADGEKLAEKGLFNKWPNRYLEELLSQYSLGSKCVGTDKSKCEEVDSSKLKRSLAYPSNVTIDDSLNPQCTCSIGSQICPDNATGAEIPMAKISTGDYLYNMNKRNISEWWIKTVDKYYKRRYGGFEFGARNPMTDDLYNFTFWRQTLDRVLKATNMGEQRFPDLIMNGIFSEIENRFDPSEVDNIRVWFNNKGWASSVAFLNGINNLILRTSIKDKEEDDTDVFFNEESSQISEYGIKVISHPMNYTQSQLDKELIRQVGVSLLHAICVIFAMSFVPASFVVFLIEERVAKVKHLHFVSGVKPITYWTASLIWDLLMYAVSAFLCILIFLMFDAQTYISKENIFPLILLMLLYGWAAVPLMYPASFLFSIPSSAFVTLACANLFIGIITTVTTFVLENFDDEELKAIGDILKYVFLVFPHYCLGRGLMDMAAEVTLNSAISKFGLESVRNRYDVDFLGKYFLCLLAQGVVFLLLTLAMQYKFWTNKIRSCRGNPDKVGAEINIPDGSLFDKYVAVSSYASGDISFEPGDIIQVTQKAGNIWTGTRKEVSGDFPAAMVRPASKEDILNDDLDEDVKREKLRVMHSAVGEDILQVKNLFKKYRKSKKQAVDRLTFGVGEAECFGLLGVNGAGKTTTFKMMTGDTDVTSGEAFINGFSILYEMDQVRQNLGYCPQFDALDPLLTGRDHLRLYARLRGLDEAAVEKVTERGLRTLGLLPYSDSRAGTYSGGNKRKLSTAIALVGDPSVVFLDEPTSGMDPGARRFLWNSILAMVKAGQSVVLTSHSMEECEALCSRLGIMVNGQFKCLGSIQHLKTRFGSGYTLTVRCNDGTSEQTSELLAHLLPQADLKEEHYTQLKYQLPRQDTKLPAVFRHMEDMRSQGLVEDYSLSQTTLDEVFIRFASDQKDVVEEDDLRQESMRANWKMARKFKQRFGSRAVQAQQLQ